MKRKVLLTGSAGFIGHHLVRSLSSKDVEVLGLDNINAYYDVNLKFGRLKEQGFSKEKIVEGKPIASELDGDLRFVKMDLLNAEKVDELVKGFAPDVVIHLAAQAGVGYSLQAPRAYLQSNQEGTLNLLEALREAPPEHFLFASSSSVYGLNQDIPFKEDQYTDHPISMYAATKKGMEMLVHTYSHLFSIPSTGLRFFTVYGPWGRPDMALFIFTERILSGTPIQVFNHGDMRRDFTFIEDIVKGVEGVMDNPPVSDPSFDHGHPRPDRSSAPYRILNIGNNGPVKLMDFIGVLEEELGKKAELRFEPMQPGDVKETYADVSELRTLTGYEPGTPIQDGIRAFVEWYSDYYQNPS